MTATLESVLQVGRATLAVLLVPVACFAGFVFWAASGPSTTGYAPEIGIPVLIYVGLSLASAAYGLRGARAGLAWVFLLLAAAPPLILFVIMI